METYRETIVLEINEKKCKCTIYFDNKSDHWIGECMQAGDIVLESPVTSHSENKELMLLLLKESIQTRIDKFIRKGVTREERCPYCLSKDVISLGMSHSIGTHPFKHAYQCKNIQCQQTFHVIKNE